MISIGLGTIMLLPLEVNLTRLIPNSQSLGSLICRTDFPFDEILSKSGIISYK